jgi:hypothetical protein
MTAAAFWDALDTTPLLEKVKRDRWGRPLIIPPDGGKPKGYTRCTTFAGVLEDQYNLTKWKQRQTAVGVAGRPDLILSVNAHRDDKEALDGLVEDAMTAAKAHAAADIGTAIHKLSEFVDRGEPLPPIPAEYVADLLAYREAMSRFEILGIERFTVLDELKIGGTHDRTVGYEGGRYVFDLKTGDIKWGALKIAIQLAVYAHSKLYDINTGERAPLDVDQDRAIVGHLPAGTGQMTLHWVDISAGWEAVQTVLDTKRWRARKDLFEAWPAAEPNLAALITGAPDRATLDALWARHAARWTDDLTALAAGRVAQLTDGRTAAHV